KAALLRVLETTRGTPAFVELVKDFKLAGQEEGLIEVAAGAGGEAIGGEAVRLISETGGTNALRQALAMGPEARRSALIQALSGTADVRAVGMLAEAVGSSTSSVADRATAIRGLARTEAGARELLGLAEKERLEEPAKTTASLALAQSRWPEIRTAAARVLPLPKTADGGELPSIAALVEARGDAARGAKVFASEQASCSKCHKVGATGTDFGPALTQIGTKLGRQALYEAILDPSSGISFGYEGWEIETRSGEEIFGLLASETEEELAIKQQAGTVVRVRKADVLRRERQKLSIMPAGLASVIGRQDLVDLVEYLTTLRAP
ncbi:MAG: c-type cytochrome, partial [Verrucomicrobiales bacterium]|nr:c-type cytochrome [Verrucomicrobiales bacterium]